MAEFKLDEIPGEISRLLKDAVYVTVGFGVLAVQKLQTQRHELAKTLDDKVVDPGKERFDQLKESFDEQLKTLESRLDTIEEKIDAALDELQGRLPEQAAEMLGHARDAVKSARKQVLELVRSEEETKAA
jgi:ElaB/YqjD/DUF883 family membrane-anchored ribosome-binding protein